ncbi:DUF6083 domain-containing protein [Streptomyces sp. NPDC052052]|uniref:DUF6083 domain-containing protein n=1 Tax=Streptomyces sp. NPDC052052 TaxID=3154756 RepID=UPI003437A9DF
MYGRHRRSVRFALYARTGGVLTLAIWGLRRSRCAGWAGPGCCVRTAVCRRNGWRRSNTTGSCWSRNTAPLAHVVPAEYRWIETSDGRVAVYGVWPPDPFQRCRIEHRLACPEQALPDLWP